MKIVNPLWTLTYVSVPLDFAPTHDSLFGQVVDQLMVEFHGQYKSEGQVAESSHLYQQPGRYEYPHYRNVEHINQCNYSYNFLIRSKE